MDDTVTSLGDLSGLGGYTKKEVYVDGNHPSMITRIQLVKPVPVQYTIARKYVSHLLGANHKEFPLSEAESESLVKNEYNPQEFVKLLGNLKSLLITTKWNNGPQSSYFTPVLGEDRFGRTAWGEMERFPDPDQNYEVIANYNLKDQNGESVKLAKHINRHTFNYSSSKHIISERISPSLFLWAHEQGIHIILDNLREWRNHAKMQEFDRKTIDVLVQA